MLSSPSRTVLRRDRRRSFRSLAIAAAAVVAVGASALGTVSSAQAGPPLTPSIVGEPAAGVFRFPQAVAVDPATGGVFVGDQYSGVIQAFDANGVFRFAFGGRAERGEPGRLGVVGGVAVDRSGHVFVLDSENDRVQIFSTDDGRYLGGFGDSSELKLKSTGFRPDSGIVAGGIGVFQPAPGATITVYVADSGNDRIARFAVGSSSLQPYGPPRATNRSLVQLKRPQGVTVSPKGDKVYVPDNQNHRVVVLHPTTLAKVGEVGSFGGGQGQFRAPYDVAVDARQPNQLYVADNLNGRVNVYDAKGLGYLGTYGGNGYRVGKFSIVRAVASSATDPAGGVYVADTANNRIQRLSYDGQVTAAWGIAGRGPGYVTRARGVAFRPDGGIAAADSFDYRIALFSPDGTFDGQFGKISTAHGFATPGGLLGQLLIPSAVAYDGAGNAWVADTYNNRVVEYAPDGQAVRSVPANRPRGLASAPDGSVYIANYGQSTIQRVLPDGSLNTVKTGIKRPSAVAVANDGTAYAATATSVVNVATGAKVPPPPGATAWDHPQGLAVAADGTLYVAEAATATPGAARVVRGTPSGGSYVWETIAGEGGGLGQVVDPANLALSRDGQTLLVADAGNNRIQRFDAPGTAPPVTQQLSVSLVGGATRGAVTSNPPGIDCGTDCTQQYGGGRTVTLTASVNAGSKFDGWGGACAFAGSAPTCSIGLQQAQSVTAVFGEIPPPPVVMSKVSVSPTRWTLLRKATKKRKRREATQARLQVSLTQPSKVDVYVLERRIGKKLGKGKTARCAVARKPKSVAKKQQCLRYATLPVKRTLRLLDGRTTATISPQFGRRALKPGLYRLKLIATDKANNKATTTTKAIRVTR